VILSGLLLALDEREAALLNPPVFFIPGNFFSDSSGERGGVGANAGWPPAEIVIPKKVGVLMEKAIILQVETIYLISHLCTILPA
jgi:hypothetical protein